MNGPNSELKEEIWFDDLTGSEEFRSAPLRITAEEIVAYAQLYDPQPFHLSEEAGKASLFGGLAASGWMTAALSMRLFFEGTPKIRGGGIGLGIDSIEWPLPVRPGDVLTARTTIQSKRHSASKPDRGILQLRTVTTNQKGETVQVLVSQLLVPKRPRR
jgi:acyl dehydratase